MVKDNVTYFFGKEANFFFEGSATTLHSAVVLANALRAPATVIKRTFACGDQHDEVVWSNGEYFE